jgi:uncharacterized protein YqjF (DUF2071 family)
MHPALKHTFHRPWPLPREGWKWRQSWLDLAFIHYRADAAAIRARLPTGLKLQEFDGSAWVGLVPFRMRGVMPRPLPVVSGRMAFPELNLRTYVEAEGKSGVWFFSLDADSAIAVAGGRSIYRLPYFRARMSHRWKDGWFEFSSKRVGEPARFAARYRGTGERSVAMAGTFEHWIAERYCLYSTGKSGGLKRVEVHHVPWPLQRAEVLIEENDLLTAAGIESLDSTPVCHFSKGVDVVSYSAKRVPDIRRSGEVGP